MYTVFARRSRLAVALACVLLCTAVQAAPVLRFTQQWSQTGQGAEIVAIDVDAGRVFNTFSGGVEIRAIDTGDLIGTFTVANAGGVNSVAVKNGVVAIAAESAVSTQDPGVVAFFNTTDAPGSVPLHRISAGALPDMLTFTPDGTRVLVANEGEPNASYTVDPEGTISIIDISGGITSASVSHLNFNAFDGSKAAIEAEGGRIFGPGASVSADLEPEYISVSPDGSTAFVTLQENNAVARIDLSTNTIVDVQGLGYKDHSLPGNALDASNNDGVDGNLQNWPVLGMYQPDAIDSYEANGQLYYVTANEGDARDYDGYSEEVRVRDLILDRDNDNVDDAFSPLQDNDRLGRLKTTTANGDIDGDGRHERIYSYGARSMSIWDADGKLVGDTGDIIEQVIADQFPARWQEGRADDKGPEPEAIKLFALDDWMYALVGLERTSGFMLFDITDPNQPLYMDYIFNEFDVGLEGIDVSIMQAFSDGGVSAWGWLAIASEVSATTTFYRMQRVPIVPTLALLGLGLLGMRRLRMR